MYGTNICTGMYDRQTASLRYENIIINERLLIINNKNIACHIIMYFNKDWFKVQTFVLLCILFWGQATCFQRQINLVSNKHHYYSCLKKKKYQPSKHNSHKMKNDLNELRTANPKKLSSFSTGKRLGKDEAYIQAIQTAWNMEFGNDTPSTSVGSPLSYQVNGINYHGYVVSSSSSSLKPKRGVLFFPTAAGPNDLFLQWKADSLISNYYNNFKKRDDDDDIVVFIVDFMSDETGWGWDTDRTQYQHVTQTLFHRNNHKRETLAAILNGAIETFTTTYNNSIQSIAAMGWCLGGKSILELAINDTINYDIPIMISYHGVFDAPTTTTTTQQKSDEKQILICNGENDPFVTKQDLSTSIHLFQQSGYTVNVQSFQNVKHGFTNPAQQYNPNDSFTYNEEAATISWAKTLTMLFH